MANLIKGRRGKVDERERRFLEAYCDPNSSSYGNGAESARLAGYSDHLDAARVQASRILSRFTGLPFIESAEAAGLSKPLVAFRLRRILDEGLDKDAINAAKMYLAILGENPEGKQASVNVHASGQVVMQIVGATPERMKRLREVKKNGEQDSATKSEGASDTNLRALPESSGEDVPGIVCEESD